MPEVKEPRTELGKIVAAGFRRIAGIFDSERSTAAERHAEVMTALNAIVTHLPALAQQVERLTLDVTAMQEARKNSNGNGAHRL